MAEKHPAPSDGDSPDQKRIRLESEASEATVRGTEPPHDQGSGSEYESDPEEDAVIQRAAREAASQPQAKGSVREAGAISKVILVQFMCHKHQVVELGPQTNFVIGHNGSGKSAVLTAITLVLGAKANATNRGSSLKSFIREGQSRAEVTLHLTNRGDEAFKPEIFGDEIIIERSISKEGVGTYKIKSGRDHRVVSTKKEYLQMILDHFMIQADNPLNVLNQDAAKKFLNASSSKEKYEFFIKGTQLQQLTDEYEKVTNNLVMSKTLLDKKKEDLPELHERARMAQKTLKEVKEASNAQAKIDQLRHELAWVYVSEAESAKKLVAENLQNEQRMLPKYEAKVEEAKAKIANLQQEINAIEAEKASRNDDELESRRVALVKTLREQSDQIKAINAELREADTSLKKLDGEIAQQTTLIDEENAKSLRNTDSSRQQAINQVSQLSKDIENLDHRLVEVKRGISEANERGKAANERSKSTDGTISSMNNEIQRLENSIRESQHAQKNRLLAFDRNADRLKHAIDAERSWSQKPLGPLGMYIRVKEKHWSQTIESVLGGSLTTYFVTTQADERLLRDLMRKNQCNAPIIRSIRELFDYSSGEPAPQYLTILRALNFEDEVVKRALINDARIEKAILVESRSQGEPIMKQARNLRPNVDACYTQDCYRVGLPNDRPGAISLRAINMYQGPPRLSIDDGSFVRGLNQQLEGLRQTVSDRQAEMTAAKMECRQFDTQLRTLKAQERKLNDDLRRLKAKKASLQDEINQNASCNVSALEDLKRELEVERTMAYNQTKELVRQRDQLNAEVSSLKDERDAIQVKLDNRQDEENILSAQLTLKVTSKVTLTSDLNHFRDSLEKQLLKIAEATQEYEAAEARVPVIVAQAKDLCKSDEVRQTTRSRKKVIADLESYNKIIKSTETRYGKTLEEIETRCHDATTIYFKAEQQIQEQDKSLRVLKAALSLRKEQWLQFRNHITVRAKMKFVTHLSKRGFIGKLNFNHNTQRLDIQVNTSEQESTQGKMKDPKALSGGEKSFSTISLLLTLWDAINCPIRCLDEFDVFMDEVNRRIAVRMMIDSAKESNDVQYIFITPNGLGFIQTGPETKIIKMADPTRNDGSLAAGRT